jgi:hypothetical protein
MSFNRFKDLPFYLTHVARSVLNTLVNEYVMDGDKSFLEEMNKRETTADLSETQKEILQKGREAKRKGVKAVWEYIFRKEVCCECD